MCGSGSMSRWSVLPTVSARGAGGRWPVTAVPRPARHRAVSGWCFFFFSSRRRHTRSLRHWSSDVCSSDLLRAPEVPAEHELPAVDDRADRPVVEAGAAERVVELVDRIERADAEPAHLVDPVLHVRDSAVRLVLVLGAAEELGLLDAEDHGVLAVVDDPPRLERVGDDPEEALAGAAGLRVDVVLELVHPLRLEVDRVHLVAGVLLVRVDAAEHAVLDEVVDHQPLAAEP